MPSQNPLQEFRVSKQNHPGSRPEDIEAEPDWSRTGNEHYPGYKNRQGRRPGHIGADEIEHEGVDIHAAWDEYQRTKQKSDKGQLVDWQDAVKSQRDLTSYQPSRHPLGWRYLLDYTEDDIKNKQDWPINVKKRKKAEEQKEQKQQQQQSEGQKSNGQTANGVNGVSGDQQNDQQQQQQQQPEKQSQQQDGQPQENQDDRSEYDKLRDKYSPEQISFLRAIQHEKDYMTALKSNDGKGRSNVRNRTTIAIDEADQFTPDNWVPRSSELIRLTGKHPLNAEAPISELYDAGFITPNELFYVRSHGAVPRLAWEYHQLEVSVGDKGRKFSMDELKNNFEPINIPVFVGCDNGRRKELNMFKRTKGFNWGPGAVGCAYWKGSLLREVLRAAGVPERMPHDDVKRYHIHLRGADNPGAAHYETSVPFEYMMDPTNDVILAYEMNDVPLPPDHGYPLRVIIPGYVGGRQVKWLQKIWITDRENDSYYHIWDNRAPPSFVTSTEDEIALTMFHHPDSTLYEMYLNSIITIPRQGEKIALKDVKEGQQYRIQGFASNGRGDEVRRVEVTLDDGKTWLYCIRTFPDAPIRHAKKFWTWCFWYVDVDIGHLIGAHSIRVRAWDVKMLTQPEKPTWNILGSMNNMQYELRSEIVNDHAPHMLWRHPVEPANMEGGWMTESAENQIADASKKIDAPNKQFTRAEVETHDKQDDCWIVVDNRVYDATSVLEWHPGGAAPIMMHAGAVHYDTTEEFSSLHDDYAYEKLNECILGVLTDKAKKLVDRTREEKEEAGATVPSEQALKKHLWVPVTLNERQWISADSAVYKFGLPKGATYLGLGTCQHIEFGFHMADRMLIRPYTPTNPVFPKDSNVDFKGSADRKDGTGSFELTVKTYFPDDEQPGGALSNFLAAMSIGEEIEIKGPTGEIVYNGHGKFNILGKERSVKRVSLVLGGTGLTPGYSMIARASLDPDDTTELRVIDANKSEDDILLRKELDELEQVAEGRLKVTHVLSGPSEKWQGLKGYVTEDIMKHHLFPPGDDNLVLLCGPPTMIQIAVLPALEDWGYQHDKDMFGL